MAQLSQPLTTDGVALKEGKENNAQVKKYSDGLVDTVLDFSI